MSMCAERRPINDLFAFLSRFLVLFVLVESTTLPSNMLLDLNRRTNVSMEKYHQAEQAILNSHTHLTRGSPSWFLSASHAMTEDAQNLTRKALRMETMAVMLVEALNMSSKEASSVLPSVAAINCPESSSFLQVMASCRGLDSRYRTHTGKCNNGLHPTWGAALEAYVRFLPPEYVDGVSMPRTDLPSAREVSSKVHSGGLDLKHPYLMALTALFGQFLIHDLAHTPKMELPDGAKLKCCDVDYEHFHPECFPIRADNTIGCMEYSRSAPHPGNSLQGCKLGPRQQINQASSYLDLSPVYGSSEDIAKALRSGKGGLLNTQRKNLPMPSPKYESCRSANKAFPCFLSGDSRVNENPGLTLMHVLFLREHNRVAAELGQLNPHWDDERLYQEARRIVIAEMEHITYNEFLPVVLGETSLDKYQLRLAHRGYFRGYDTRTDATLSNAVASAGLFFIAALTPKTLDLVDSRSALKSGERSLLSAFYAPQEFYEAGAIDRLISGATAGHSRKPLPPGLNEILLERYFHDGKSNDIAVDYAAQVIQQGRDHGLSPYIRWRTFCDLPDISSFDDLRGSMAKDTIERLRAVYKNVEDIDLVTGALSEAPVSDSVLGPTFLCLLGRTFRNLRLGDRYWYENANSPGSFPLSQLEEIRKVTMAQILCYNGDRLNLMQPRAFLLKDRFLNDVTNCSIHMIGSPNFSSWKDKNVS
ncbi:peroxidasin-like isoform X1 [Hylaeus anthracinus]|uniref:peroxidasin-like isoform X1 n=2 Tax=Hylaeus volcanicus TaxID=313075 RepID=UPI0023B784C2|nr:peroxidasin-like isoform X1 [Hylaeus volcanicus]XP_054005185.1 peroxidasin-like isoform X1 [Hylaeus anthracinus]